ITARIKIQGWWNGSSDDYKVYSDYERATYDVHGDDNEIRATYVLNGGGEVITLETTNADIHILKLERK
ncbi:MAG TPA: hypothetical protein VKS81_05190, partial [Bacteroidota bacterium]|nr:hypothetical protein [Bacteroidota bacterium]